MDKHENTKHNHLPPAITIQTKHASTGQTVTPLDFVGMLLQKICGKCIRDSASYSEAAQPQTRYRLSAIHNNPHQTSCVQQSAAD